MDERGKILSTVDVDKNLTLQIWTKGKTPRLAIVNRNKNVRKLIPLSWLEDKTHKISLNAKIHGETISYNIPDLTQAIQKILTDFVTRTTFKIKFFKLAIDLEKALFNPEYIIDLDGMPMLSEEKRSALWFASCTSKNKSAGKFKAFFPVEHDIDKINDEASAIENENVKLNFINNARTVEALIKTGVIEKLKKIKPERWHNPIRLSAAAMLFGFSFCREDGVKFSDKIWSSKKPQPTTYLNRAEMLTYKTPDLMKLGYKISAYIRHFYQVNKIQVDYSIDSAKDFQDEGYSRTRRVDFQAGTLGDVPYRVTFYEDGDRLALACVPEMSTIRHAGELKIIMPLDIFESALKLDTNNGGTQDQFYTITRLFWAYDFKKWLDNISIYVKNFAGVKE